METVKELEEIKNETGDREGGWGRGGGGGCGGRGGDCVS